MRVDDAGVTLSAGSRFIVAETVCIVSIARAAVRVIFWPVATRAGAVYVVVLPFVASVPTAGFSAQITAVFGTPATVAVNVWDCEGFRETVAVFRDIVKAATPALWFSIPSTERAIREVICRELRLLTRPPFVLSIDLSIK
jgi:hypothetical protein